MKTISKINEKIFNLVSEIAELQDQQHDFDTREGKICANIKVYDWIDSDDVLTVCDLLNVSKKQRKHIIKEFNDDRLNNIYNHVCENEVRHLKDMYEGNCDISNFEAIFSTWRRSNNTDNITKEFYMENYKKDSYYINEYWDQCKAFKTSEEWKTFILKGREIEFKEYQKRNLIDKFECWQYGRSGGWFSICDEDEAVCTILDDNYDGWIFQSMEEAYNANDNTKFNEVINEYLNTGEIKKDFLNNLKMYLSDYNEKINAITQIIEDIEGSKTGFKNCVIEELNYEVNEYLSNEFSTSKTNVTIKIEDEKIKTSLGVTIDETEFKNAFKLLLPKFKVMQKKEVLDIKTKVGNYFVEYAKKTKNDIIIKAGCHRFSFNNLSEVLT
jgi:hypothetical protein